MLSAGIAFLLGVLGLCQMADLPSIYWAGLLPVFLLFLFVFPKCRFFLTLACGFLWALWMAHAGLAQVLDSRWDKQTLAVEGVIVSIPAKRTHSTRFEFLIDKIEHEAAADKIKLPLKVRLDWYSKPPSLVAGERWQLRVRLKTPHGFANPGGFDYEGWLFQKGIRATGYVRTVDSNRKIVEQSKPPSLTEVRQYFFEHLQAYAFDQGDKNLKNIGLLSALTIGERQLISQSQWETFRQTGTSHLIAISGLHIGLIAAFVYGLFMRFLKLRFIVSARLYNGLFVKLRAAPAQQISAVAALIAATIYAALAGFTLPTMRALIMLVVAFSGMLLRRECRPLQGISTALLLILLLDPLAVNTAGFWLSFLAVAALILLLYGRKHTTNKILHWGKIQITLALVLLPVTLIWFQQAAVAASLSNVLAIPVVGFLVVPLALLGSVLLFVWEAAGFMLLSVADSALSYLMLFLEWVSHWPLAQWRQQSPPVWTWFPAFLGVLLLLMPRGFPAKWLAIILVAPVFLIKPSHPKKGDIWVSFLDVGQGLSVLIETAQHTLLYDAGARFSKNFDAGKTVVIPFLRNRNINQLDRVIASHADADHAGGLLSVLKALPVKSIMSSAVDDMQSKYNIKAKSCYKGQTWVWDAVSFQMLHPLPQSQNLFSGNNASCVLKISSAYGSVLLTGDIEDEAEETMLDDFSKENREHLLNADIMLVPHHGSRTSSSEAFIAAVNPRYAVFAVGYRNRFGFPKPDIVARYKDIEKILTSQEGAVMFKINSEGVILTSYRDIYKRFWHWKDGSIKPKLK